MQEFEKEIVEATKLYESGNGKFVSDKEANEAMAVVKKAVNLKIDADAHKALKELAASKGMKFYALLESLLEDKAKRIKKDNK